MKFCSRRRSKGDKCSEINYFDTPTLTGRGKHGGGKHGGDKSEPLAALYPNYRNVFFSRLDQDFTPVMELPKTFRIALPSGQLISRPFPNNTSVYEVVSRLASEYEFDPTRVVVTHKGDELPPAAVLLADISPDGTLRLSFRKHKGNTRAGGNGTSSAANKYNTAPQKHMQHEMNNNHGGYSTEKTSKKALGASTDNASSDGKPVGPPQQVKVDVTIPELNNKMVIRISPLLTCRDLLNIVCHNKKLDKSQREIRLANGPAPNVASSSQPINDISRLVVTVGVSFVVCQASRSINGPIANGSEHQLHMSTPQSHSNTLGLPTSSGAAATGRRLEMSAPSTPLYGTKEKKKRLSFFGLMKGKSRNKNDDIYASGPFDPFSSSPATTSSPIQVGELRKKLQHSPSLDGVLDEPFSTSLRETPSRPLPLQHSTHFGGSDFDITTSSSTRVGAGGVNDVSSSMIDHTTLPTVLSHPTTNTSSSSNLQSFAPMSKHRSAENVSSAINGIQKSSPTSPEGKEVGTNSRINSNDDEDANSDFSGGFNMADVKIYEDLPTPSSNFDPTESAGNSPHPPAGLVPATGARKEIRLRKRQPNGASMGLARSNLRVMSYSSTPDIVTDVERNFDSYDQHKNSSLKFEGRHGDDYDLTLSSDLLLGPSSSPRTSVPRKLAEPGGSVGLSGGPPRRKAPPPPPKKTATLSGEDIYGVNSNGVSVESMSELSADPPAIPKRMALGNQVDTFSKYTPQPLPRVSSLQTARGELPPSVVKIRQRHQNENSGRAVDSNRRQTIGGSSVYPSQNNEDMNCGEGQESELVIPPPPHETPPSARGLRSKRRPLSTCESVCSCVHSGYASSVAGRGGGEGSNVDLCSQCCSCRSSNITLLAENDNDNMSDVISIRSETSSLDHFGVEMDNMVAMAEFALSDPNLNLKMEDLDSHSTLDSTTLDSNMKYNTVQTWRQGVAAGGGVGGSSVSLATTASSGQATPKAVTPVNMSRENFGLPDFQRCTPGELKSVYESLLQRLDEVKSQLVLVGECDWLTQYGQSKSVQTEDNKGVGNMNSIEPPPKFTDNENTSKESSREGTRRSKPARKRTKSKERLSKEFDEYRIKPKESESEEVDENVEIAVKKPVNQQSKWRPIESFKAKSSQKHCSNGETEINIDDVMKAPSKNEEELALYVPEPNDQDFYISFGNPSPTANSPKLRSKTNQPNDSVGSPKFVKKSKLKSVGSMDNLSRPSSAKKYAAPKPPRTRSVSNLEARSLNSTLDGSAVEGIESVNSSMAVETADESAALTKGRVDEPNEKSPNKIVPGAVKAKRALFEAYNDTNLSNFRVRKSHDCSSSRSGDNQKMMKAASTSDLVWAMSEEMPKVVSRYKKKQGPKYNPRTGESVTDSATVGRPTRNLPSRPEAPDDDTNEDGESAVGSSDSDGKGVSSTRKKFVPSSDQRKPVMKNFGSKMNHLL